jgi:cytochrome c1
MWLLLILLLLASLSNACVPERPMAEDAPPLAGNAELGRQAIRQYGCNSCHVIPGVRGANSYVGPPLTAWAERHYIAGKLPNEPEYLEQWIRFPQAIEPGTAMPNMDVTEQAARDISAYLYTLDEDQRWWPR